MNKGKTCFAILVLCICVLFTAAYAQQLSAQAEKGIALYKSQKYQDAESALREALKSQPSEVEVRYYLGLSLLQLEKYKDALDEFKKCESDQARASQWARSPVPSDYQFQLGLARACLGLQQNDEAWKHLESARIEDPSSEVFLYRGVFYLNQKKSQDAAKELEKAINLDSKNALAHYHAGLAYSELGNRDKAAASFRAFLQLAPDAPQAAKAKSMLGSTR